MTQWCRISTETLSAFVDRELAPRRCRRLACHVADCPSCSQRLGALYAMKSYVGSAEQAAAPLPAGLWRRLRDALDTVDRVAQSLPHLTPRPVPAWRLPTLAAMGVVLVLAALCVRQWAVMRPTTPELLAVAHRSSVARLLTTAAGADTYQPVSTHPGPTGWQPLGAAVVHIGNGFGQQQIYQVGPAILSYFSLPDRPFEPDEMIIVRQGPHILYVSTGAGLSMVGWREPGGWGVLVADSYADQLLPLAELRARAASFPPDF